ncbi:ABC transporter ATP-binding protein [Sorangium sp. So ce321]|uniref:ABC transporter ATP-binding protein n=1 Tax=Sorangium sp. So ce321 TaxID=3133300 RepID=UPI003F646A4A
MHPALLAERLVKRYGDFTAVEGVDLAVHPGEIVGLLGPNGAGKTTTLRMLAGILSPTGGRVAIGGVDLAARPLEAKQRIGFLSGDTQLYQRLTPREVLRYFGRLYGMKEPALSRRIDALVADLEMDAFASRPCGTLSTGQKQRANIARAFLHEPEVLILDEPTTALDIISGRFIVESIRRERAAGKAVLFSTHIMGEAEYLCDRIALLHEGRIADTGALPELLERAGATNLTDAFLHHVARSRPREARDAPERGGAPPAAGEAP